MSNANDFLKFIEKIKKNPKSAILIIMVICLTWKILSFFPLEYQYKGINLNKVIAIALIFIEMIGWLIYRLHLHKNKTNKHGIAFLIISKEIEKDDIEKENFFKMLKNETENMFNVLVYTSKDFKRYSKDYTMSEIMKELNLTILFEIKERKGNINNDNNYEIEIINAHISFPFVFGIEFIPNFRTDLVKSINKHIRISHKNSLEDNKKEIGMLELSSLYIMSILQIVSPEPEKSFNLLDNISGILRITKLKKTEYKYIEKNIPYRYLEAYQNTICKLLITEEYYSDMIILNRIKKLLDDMLCFLVKNKNEGKIEKQCYKKFYENYLLQNAIVEYEKNGPQKALETINKCDFSMPNNNGAYFSKAFLLMMCGKIEESVTTYIKLLQRKNLEQSQIEEVLSFINDREKQHPKNIYMKFCYGIINFFRKDKKLAFKIFNEIKKKDKIVKNEIIRIIRYDKHRKS